MTTMHIYAFGSICRGEVSLDSDIDLLAVVKGHDGRLDQAAFSIYSYKRIREIWLEGNPFAWHLSLEARLIYSSDSHDFLKQLGPPGAYRHCYNDCSRFFRLFDDAQKSIEVNNKCLVFDLSTTFLSIRNFASCYSLGVGDVPDFSRPCGSTLKGR
jgi:Nucleotidyltransferase domain